MVDETDDKIRDLVSVCFGLSLEHWQSFISDLKKLLKFILYIDFFFFLN